MPEIAKNAQKKRLISAKKSPPFSADFAAFNFQPLQRFEGNAAEISKT